MRACATVIGVSCFVLAVMAAHARDEEAPCVVCGGPTRGERMVVHGGQAYWVHAYPCRGVWDRALAAGALQAVDGPLAPGHAVFREVPLEELESAPATPIGGSAWFWAFFALLAACLSGGLGTLFAVLTHRPPAGGFLLGFLLPAVGMVLVPILPQRKPSPKTDQPGGNDE